MIIQSYRDLIAWDKGIDLCRLIYKVTRPFPSSELYGLTSQLRRAAVSVPSNIAEGSGRISTGEFIQSVGHSRGSLYEVETQIEIAYQEQFLDDQCYSDVLLTTNELGKILNGLIRSLERR
jgi:four helix bundle protein